VTRLLAESSVFCDTL